MPITDYKTASSFSFHFGKTKTKTKKKRQTNRYMWKYICQSVNKWLSLGGKILNEFCLLYTSEL